MTQLDLRDLTVEYDAAGYAVRPIDGLNLTATTGELVLLLGPSGCGKTTLLSVLAGILSPTSGEVLLDGRRVDGLQGAELTRYRRHDVGVVFQAFNLVPSLTALENVAAPLWAAGVRHREAKVRATELLEAVGLGDRARHRPGALSGGQQQRVAIARALVHEPPLLLADEPTAHLDHVQVEVVLRTLRDLAAPGRLVVVATHDDRMTPLADRVINLRPDLTPPPDVTTVKLAAGEQLFGQGDRGNLVYVVERGTVVVSRGAEVLATYGRGDYFGELGAMLAAPRAGTATAQTAAVVTGYAVTEFRLRLREGRLLTTRAPRAARARARAAGAG